MAVYVRYYKFTDPISKTITKIVGWEIIKDVLNAEVIIQDGKLLPVRQSVEQSNYKVLPRVADLEQIPKDVYDKLDTTGESLFYQELRDRRETAIARYIDRFREEPKKPTVEEHLAKVEALNDKILKGEITPVDGLKVIFSGR